MSKSSSLTLCSVNDQWYSWYSWHFYYANMHSCYSTEPKLTAVTKHSHMDWHVNTLTHTLQYTLLLNQCWKVHRFCHTFFWAVISWFTFTKVHLLFFLLTGVVGDVIMILTWSFNTFLMVIRDHFVYLFFFFWVKNNKGIYSTLSLIRG